MLRDGRRAGIGTGLRPSDGASVTASPSALSTVHPDVLERSRPEVGRRVGSDEVAQERLGARQAPELLGTRIAAGQVTDDGRCHGGVAGHQPIEPTRLDGRYLQLLENILVIHGSPRDGQRSGPASSAGAR